MTRTKKKFQFGDIIEPTNLKPLVIALMCMVGQQLSGVNAVIFFSVNIFEAAKTSLNSFIENIIIGLTQVVATALAALIIDRLGRRYFFIKLSNRKYYIHYILHKRARKTR